MAAKSASERHLAEFKPMAPALLPSPESMSLNLILQRLGESFSADTSAALLVIGLAVIVLIVLASDDDLPGPRRCFARAAGRQ